MRAIELLSPAKNIECGLAAINHGADAVYIGASRFSARAAAGNSIQHIEQLARYAHKYNARVYAAVNTILYDHELEDVRKLIWQLYQAGADALIVQDMGILQMDLPPIALHASTQTDNRTPEKVRFFQQMGFSQVVLARELSLEQIRQIAAQTTVPLEFFVHGALCVCYSGQCYISQAMAGRSANRGECAQYCRLPYDLLDGDGNLLMHDKHLLSLKDFNLSAALSDLLDAGISSFKIEGRLKDAPYVKNVTAYYRQKLDNLLEGAGGSYKKSSSGKTTFFFTPNPEKSFNRGTTTYFLYKREPNLSSFATPKSVGEHLGRVKEVGKNFLGINTSLSIHNGDGLCYITPSGDFAGFRVNRVEGNRIFPLDMPKLKPGTEIYRNYDIEFEKLLDKKSAERKMSVRLTFSETDRGFKILAVDEDDYTAEALLNTTKELATNMDKAMETIQTQLRKWGNSDYVVEGLDVQLSEAFFIPSSQLADIRRNLMEALDEKRAASYLRMQRKRVEDKPMFPKTELSYLGNVSNYLAEEFYRQHGVTAIEPALELNNAAAGRPLMYTKYCLKFQLGMCSKQKPTALVASALSLRYKDMLFSLTFDCAACEMVVQKKG